MSWFLGVDKLDLGCNNHNLPNPTRPDPTHLYIKILNFIYLIYIQNYII